MKSPSNPINHGSKPPPPTTSKDKSSKSIPKRAPPPRSKRFTYTDHDDFTRSFQIKGTSFRISNTFSPLGIVGKGSYGVVCAATDDLCGGRVAIKKIKPVSGDTWDAKHVLRELRLMRLMEHHPNVISLLDLNIVEAEDELYIVMELMDSDLHKIIQSKQSLTRAHLQVLMKQILNGVKAMHQNNVLHRDLKPGNILVGKDCQVRITDFGLARSIENIKKENDEDDDGNEENKNPASAMTEYVVTRWYRCPELLLAPHVAYSSAVDLWSVGCIFAELILREPLFPGRSYVHQVQLILDAIGTPPDVAAMGFEPRKDAAAYLKRQKSQPGRPWSTLFPGADPEAVDLISHLLLFNPKLRFGSSDALNHGYFRGTTELPCKEEQKTPGGENLTPPPVAVDFDFDNDTIKLEELKRLILGEVKIMQERNRIKREALREKKESRFATEMSPSRDANNTDLAKSERKSEEKTRKKPDEKTKAKEESSAPTPPKQQSAPTEPQEDSHFTNQLKKTASNRSLKKNKSKGSMRNVLDEKTSPKTLPHSSPNIDHHSRLIRVGSHGKMIDRGNGSGLSGSSIHQPADSTNAVESLTVPEGTKKSPKQHKTLSKTRSKIENAIKSSQVPPS